MKGAKALPSRNCCFTSIYYIFLVSLIDPLIFPFLNGESYVRILYALSIKASEPQDEKRLCAWEVTLKMKKYDP